MRRRIKTIKIQSTKPQMKVFIDDVLFLPARSIDANQDDTARAIIRALVSGYYNNLECHQDGKSPKPHCDCEGCRMYRVACQFLGGRPACDEEEDEGFQMLYKACDK
jgi:hypothetical protein